MDRSTRTRPRQARRPRRVAVTLPLALLTVLILPTSRAWALPGETPDDTWQFNGPTRTVVKVGGTIFVGGDFTELREDPIGVQGGEVIPVNNFAALDAATGAPIPRMFVDPPDFTGDGDIVIAMTLAGGKLWVGGKFKAVEGAARYNLAALDPATLSVDPLKPRTGGVVHALADNGTTVFAGGKFAKVNGQPRNRLAAFSTDGDLSNVWTAGVSDRVVDLAVSPDGTQVFATGDFKSASGSGGSSQDRNSLAVFNAASGALSSWQPGGGPYSQLIRGVGVTVTSDRVYWATGGSDWVAAYNLSTGSRIFKTETDGTVAEAVEMGDRLIIGGHFLLVGRVPGGPGCDSQPEACESHIRLAALTMNGSLDQSWNPKLQGEWQGTKRLLVDGGSLWIAGVFTKITGVDQSYFGRLS